MSRSITQTSSSSSAVAAGSSVIVPVNTTTGFSAGDYVYTLPTGGVGTRATGTIGVGGDVNYVATTFATTYLSTGNFRTFSYGPYIDQALYSGTTKTYGTVTVATTQVAAYTSQFYRSCTLLNGNVVQMYSSSTTLLFRIIDNTGAIIKAETNLSNSYYASTEAGNFDCCCLTSGNIQFVWNENVGFAITVQQYTSAGIAIGSKSNQTSTQNNPGNYRIAALSGGGSVVTMTPGFTAASANITFTRLDSSGVAVGFDTVGSGLAGGQAQLFPVIGLPASYGTNLWACWVQNTTVNNSTYTGQLNIYSNGTFVARATTTGNGGQFSTYNFNLTLASDGTICCAQSVYGYSGNVAKFTYTRSTNTTGTLTFNSTTYVGDGYNLFLIPTSDGAVNCIYTSGGAVQMVNLSSTNVLGSYSAIGTVQNSPYYGRFTATGFGSGLVTAMCSSNSGTAYSVYSIANTFDVTNGVTVLTGASYLPSGGYYLMGVAATDAAANATGQVIMNGTAQLGSTYPTVTTPIYYSYQTTASQPLFGQRGSVSATTVTLRGLEA